LETILAQVAAGGTPPARWVDGHAESPLRPGPGGSTAVQIPLDRKEAIG